jgi:CheY-like chemotaxis protein
MGESLGWVVDVATSGEQALDMLKARTATGVSYHAVFVDWQMPGLDGWETSQRIRESGLNGAAPIIVMVTANGLEMLAQRSPADQALLDGFLVKPVTASMLFDAVVHARSGHAHAPPSRPGAAPGGKRLTGMRLLVAEDNPGNQQVARELLEDEGAVVQIANDGQEAVEAIAAADPPFDVVLMDLQMPVMDGLTAASRVRQDLKLPIPIVAMTANVMASDREACLEAGMNDHVGKPFNIDHLVRVLCTQTGRQQAPGNTPTVAAWTLPTRVSDAAVAAGVDITAALNRLGGNQDLYQRLLRMFVNDLADIPAQLAACVARGEAQAAMRVLHTLKGQAGTMGAMALSAEAADGEKQLAGGLASDDAELLVQQTSGAIAAGAAGLAALLQALQVAEAPMPAPARPLDTDAVLTRLRSITRQLRNADMAATDAMADLRRHFGGALGEQLQPMDEAIGALDFDRALRLCNTLIDNMTEGQPA